MTHTYNISGMTCSGCQVKVQTILSKVNGVKNVAIDLSKGEAIIDMDKHVAASELKSALKDYPKYQLTESRQEHNHVPAVASADEETRSWIETYKPILLIFGYLAVITTLVEVISGVFTWTRWMEHFMAGFFLVFSFFKLLNLSGFADSYSTYDIIARKWNAWSYIYAFVELGLGIAFLTRFNPILTNGVVFAVMSVSIIGVVQSVTSKRKIKCACLGAVFNLPMSTITIIEDALMIAMSGVMLAAMI
jgi:copper chaperone CopZ